MKNRIVNIKIPILLECDAFNVKEMVVKKFGCNIFVSLDYREKLTENVKINALKDQFDILDKLGYTPKKPIHENETY